jgi:hypothetical protein
MANMSGRTARASIDTFDAEVDKVLIALTQRRYIPAQHQR